MLGAGLLLTLLAAAPPDAERVRLALDDVWRGGEYQRELPSGDRPAPGPAARPAPRREPGTSSSLGVALLWVVGAAGAVVVAVAIAQAWGDRSGRAGARAAPGAAARAPLPDPAVVERPLADAEALAERGRFSEAIHVLLLRLLAGLSARTSPPIADSLTSREIVARVAVPDGARAPLRHLVGAVEATHFGREVPSRDDYDRCLARYREFAAAYGSAA